MLCVGLSACAPPGPSRASRGERPVLRVGAFDPEAYCELAHRAGIAELTPSTAISCEPVDRDRGDEDLPRCRLLVADASGRPRETPLEGIVSAWPLENGRYVVLTSDERLVLHDGRSELATLAEWAAEPAVDPAGRRVVFVGAAEGTDRAELGDATSLVLVELESGRRARLSADETASAPLFTPDGRSVLYVSTWSGVAAIHRVSIDGESHEQLTNEGLNDVGQGFVPVYENERVWLGTTLVYAALGRDERAEIWALDARTGDARRIGEGSHPLVTDDGRLVVAGDASGSCPISLDLEVTP